MVLVYVKILKGYEKVYDSFRGGYLHLPIIKNFSPSLKTFSLGNYLESGEVNLGTSVSICRGMACILTCPLISVSTIVAPVTRVVVPVK